MKEVIKAFIAISFLVILMPSGKLTIPNGGILFITILQIFEYFPDKGLKLNLNLESLMALITSVSFIFILMQRKLYNLIGIALQLAWLGYLFKKDDINDVYYVVTVLIYLLMTLSLIFQLYFYKKTSINSN